MKHFLFSLLCLGLIAVAPVLAQRDTVRPAPGQVEMRRMWIVKGGPGSRTGGGAGPVGDINHDGIGDFAVSTYIPWQWSVYLGGTAGPSTTPDWTFDSGSALRHPVVGDFWGTGHPAVGFAREIEPDYTYAFLHLFRTESGTLPDTPAVIWQSVRPGTPRVIPFVEDYVVADLDGDGADELIVVSAVVRRGDGISYIGEMWIYKGGPDFQVDTPTVIVRGPKAANRKFQLYVANLDSDSYPDLVTRSDYGYQSRMEFYFGSPEFFASTQVPDREFIIALPLVMDIDGDGISDIVTDQLQIYRSGSGKSMRTRSYDSTDIDHTIFSGRTTHRMFDLGYLNSKKYRMFGVELGGALTGFSGSPDGVNGYAEAFTGGGPNVSSSPFGAVIPVGDINGDGWNDIICSRIRYPDIQNSDEGIAIIFAGGTYIPNDEPVLSAPSVSTGGRRPDLRIWPNPASELVALDWGSNTGAKTVEVRDILGRLVESFTVEPGSSQGYWDCQQLAAGIYLVTVSDQVGRRLLVGRFVKQ